MEKRYIGMNEIELNNININNLEVFFSTPTLKKIAEHNITNLEQLFNVARNPNFVICFGHLAIYNELNGTIRLLRCKYLNEDPLIDINDENINDNELYALLGLSTRSTNCLRYFCRNAKEFFEKMRTPIGESSLKSIRNLGDKGFHEIIYKARIVINYYDNLKEKEEASNVLEKQAINNDVQLTNEDVLEYLNELRRLQEKRKKLDAQIDNAIVKIQEKIYEKTERRTLK